LVSAKVKELETLVGIPERFEPILAFSDDAILFASDVKLNTLFTEPVIKIRF
jgi:hypothetical protein